jgi:hypothetical protein
MMTTKQYYARSEIQHGEADGKVTVFAVGQQVTGLPKDAMIALWNAGVLTEVDPSQRPADDRDDRIAQLEARIAELNAQKAAAEAEPALVKPVGSTELPENPVPNSPQAASQLAGTVADPKREEDTGDGTSTGTDS